MEIQLKNKFLTARFKSPFKNFEIDEQKIEIRIDPLTGKKARININRTKRINFKQEDYTAFIEASKENCPFCPGNIEKSTPTFEDGKRIVYEDATVFPNMFPYSSRHAILVMTKEHYLPLNMFNSKLLFNSFSAALKFFKEYGNPYPSLNFNYMLPAGASLVHPHMQLLSENNPLSHVEYLIKKSKTFYNKHKKIFWDELVKTEKKLKERFIGESKNFVYIAKYAPVKNNNILIVSKSAPSLLDLSEKQIKDLSEGLSLIFKGLGEKLHVNSLNLSSFSASKSEKFYRLNFEIVTRTRLKPFYNSDIGFMEYMQNEPVAETLPEDTAKALYFGRLKYKI